MERVVHRTCTLCEACCGIEVHVAGDRIVRIQGDERDPLSKGYLCPKAWALKDLHEDPDRLRYPIRRTSTGWERVSWRAAFSLAVNGILRTQRHHGRDAVAIYRGEPVTHNLGAVLFGDALLGAVGTRNHFSANTLDQMPKQLASHWMYGSGFFMSVPDIDRTAHLLIIGANPVVSNGSLMTAPGMPDRLRAIRGRGGRVVVIDPRHSETARLADEHHFIRPGSDALLVAGLINTIVAEGRVRLRHLGGVVDGLETIHEVVATFTAATVADHVGIGAETIRSIARAFSDAPSAVCYGRMGTSTVRFGTLTNWLIEVLNLLTGNLDRAGGAMFPNPPVDVVALQPSTQRGRWRSRTRGTPEFIGELPAATLAEEIGTPGPGQVRALVTLAGNPVLSSPAGHELDRALRTLECMVAIDFYLNETTRHADVILPPVGPLEREHFDVVFQLFAVRNAPRWCPAVFPSPPEGRCDGEILLELASRLHWSRGGLGRVRAVGFRAPLWIGTERALRLVVDLALRAGPHGNGMRPWRAGVTLKRLQEAVSGIDLGPMQPGLPARLPAKSKRIAIAPDEVVADMARLRESMRAPAAGLLLIGRRELRTVNSWSHNWPSLVTGKNRCELHIHPVDAEARGLEDGAVATVASRVGTVAVPVRITCTMMPGAVSLPHGYGHGREGARLNVAADHAGASVNDLTDPAELDVPSGNAVLSGIPVRVEHALFDDKGALAR